jgi:hypothetical protein
MAFIDWLKRVVADANGIMNCIWPMFRGIDREIDVSSLDYNPFSLNSTRGGSQRTDSISSAQRTSNIPKRTPIRRRDF